MYISEHMYLYIGVTDGLYEVMKLGRGGVLRLDLTPRYCLDLATYSDLFL